MKTLFAACLLTLACRVQAQTIHTPAPLWTSKVAVRRAVPLSYWPHARIAAAASDVVCIVADPGTVSALDARTGRTLWQRGPTPPDRQRERSDDTRWDVLGTAEAAGTRTIVVLTQTVTSAAPHGTPKSQPLPPAHFFLEGVEARSNRVLWRSKDYVDAPYKPDAMRHGVVSVPIKGQEPADKHWEYSTHREYLDARTGTLLNLNTPEGRAHMKRLLAVYGGTILENNGSHGGTLLENPVFPGSWVRAETGTAEALPLPNVGGGYIYPELTRNGIIVSRVNTNDDGTGHSMWPIYLVGSDLKGRRLWHFPAKIQWSKDSPDTFAAPEGRIRNIIALPDTDLFLAENDAGGIFGLTMRDGKVVWQLPARPFWLAPIANSDYDIAMQTSAVYRAGCFAYVPPFAQNANKRLTASVMYILARTGRTLPILSGQPVQQVAVGGDTLFVQTAVDTFRAYSIPAFPALIALQRTQPQALTAILPAAQPAILDRFEGDLEQWQVFGSGVNSYRLEGNVANVNLYTSGSTMRGGIYSPTFAVVKDRPCRFAFDVRTDNPKAGFFAVLQHFSKDASPFASFLSIDQNLDIRPTETWQRLTITLRPDRSDSRAVLFLGSTVSDSGEGKSARLWIRNVALLPEKPMASPHKSKRRR